MSAVSIGTAQSHPSTNLNSQSNKPKTWLKEIEESPVQKLERSTSDYVYHPLNIPAHVL
jgi:hypothetical protein